MYSTRLAVIVTLSFTLAMIACSPAADSPSTLDLAAKASAPQTTTAVAPSPDFAELEEAVESMMSEEVVEPEIQYASFTLRHGERLDHFARWSQLPVEVIAESSGLNLSRPYRAGIEILVPIEGEGLAALQTARDAHHTKRAEGYLASRGGAVGSEFITVRTGDNATTIARDQQGLPLWLVETFNPSVDLDQLRPGQLLMMPILADIVVDAGDLYAAPCAEPGVCPDSLLED